MNTENLQGTDIVLSDSNEVFIKFQGDEEYLQVNNIQGVDQEQDNVIDSWIEYGDGGYYTNIKTGQNLSFAFTVVRRASDEVHNKLIDISFNTGQDAIVALRIVGPNETIELNATADITNSGISGEAGEKLVISGSFRSIGKPTIKKEGYADKIRMVKPAVDKK